MSVLSNPFNEEKVAIPSLPLASLTEYPADPGEQPDIVTGQHIPKNTKKSQSRRVGKGCLVGNLGGAGGRLFVPQTGQKTSAKYSIGPACPEGSHLHFIWRFKIDSRQHLVAVLPSPSLHFRQSAWNDSWLGRHAHSIIHALTSALELCSTALWDSLRLPW